MQKDKLSV